MKDSKNKHMKSKSNLPDPNIPLRNPNLIENEFNFYLKNQAELAKKYNGKFIVLKNESVIGTYDSQYEAYNETVKAEELGTFLIQHCLSGKDSYTQTFHSQVIIYGIA